jgi:hypothetical protein
MRVGLRFLESTRRGLRRTTDPGGLLPLSGTPQGHRSTDGPNRSGTQRYKRFRMRALAVSAVAVVMALTPWVPWYVSAIVCLLCAAFTWLAKPVQDGALELDAKGLVRCDPEGGRERLIDFAKPFGVTLMASKHSDVAWLGFTTPERTGLLRTHRDAFDGEKFHVLEEDLDHGVAEVSAPEARKLLRELGKKQHAAFQKMYLTGSLGESIELDGPLFRVDQARFDLVLPYEVRHFAFVERVGRVDGLYEATWIKQGPSEVVLVSSMGAGAETPVASPPPRKLRHAVDRVFFPTLLSALAKAKNKRLDLS